MCHECDNDNNKEREFSMEDIPEYEREEFIEFAMDQFHSVMEKAVKHDVLFELITEWPHQKQAMFTFTTVMENRLFSDE
jgi:hypothetical protein